MGNFRSFFTLLIALPIIILFHADKFARWLEYSHLAVDNPAFFNQVASAKQSIQNTPWLRTLNTLDCGLEFMFNDTYKNLTKCRDHPQVPQPTMASEAGAPAESTIATVEITYAQPPLEPDEDVQTPTGKELHDAPQAEAGQNGQPLAVSVQPEVARETAQAVPHSSPSPELNATEVAELTPTTPPTIVEDAIKPGPLPETKPGPPLDSKREPVPEKADSPQAPPPGDKRILLVAGDSMADDLAVCLTRILQDNENVTILPRGKASSGLVRRDFYDWEQSLPALVKSYSPDSIIFMAGANDVNQDIIEDKTRIPPGSEEWLTAYGERMRRLLDMMTETGLPVFWVGLPIMQEGRYCDRVKLLNTTLNTVCQEYENCHFVDTWDTLADKDGNYACQAKNDKGSFRRIRREDGIHFNTLGGLIVGHYFLESTFAYLNIACEHRDFEIR